MADDALSGITNRAAVRAICPSSEQRLFVAQPYGGISQLFPPARGFAIYPIREWNRSIRVPQFILQKLHQPQLFNWR
jgi:hypothetical protein